MRAPMLPLLPRLVLLTLLVPIIAACNPLAGLGATVAREGTRLNIVVQGYREADTQGYLCPADPGPGPDRGEEGHSRLLRAGCLDLGVTEVVDPDARGWSATVNLESLASAQLEAFSNRTTYRLVLVSGGEEGGRSYATDVPAVNLVP